MTILGLLGSAWPWAGRAPGRASPASRGRPLGLDTVTRGSQRLRGGEDWRTPSPCSAAAELDRPLTRRAGRGPRASPERHPADDTSGDPEPDLVAVRIELDPEPRRSRGSRVLGPPGPVPARSRDDDPQLAAVHGSQWSAYGRLLQASGRTHRPPLKPVTVCASDTATGCRCRRFRTGWRPRAPPPCGPGRARRRRTGVVSLSPRLQGGAAGTVSRVWLT